MLLSYIGRRLLYGLILIFLISILVFGIIQLPPGDYATSYVAQLQSQNMEEATRQRILEGLTQRYGLDQPIHIQYYKWVKNIILHGDFGESFAYNQPVIKLIMERLPITVLISLIPLLFQFIIAPPIAMLSALKQNTWFDYIFTFLAFIGQSIPNFLLALVLMVFLFNTFGFSIGGLFSLEFQDAPWSMAKFFDMLKHLIVPVIVIGTASTAGVVRQLRATMLDELGKEYMRVARAKGMPEWKIVIKYPLRIAINPILAGIGHVLPQLLSGSLMVSIVLNLPTMGPLQYNALLNQDMYVAGSIILILSVLTIIGTLISDILLAFADPRISYMEGRK
jgi:peptide/nickel transport system permease protein